MPGRGDPLSDKILEEVRSILALFLRNIRQHRVNLGLIRPTTHFALGLSSKTLAWPLKMQAPSIHDPLQSLRAKQHQSHAVALLPQAMPASASPCQWQPALCFAATFSADTLPWHRVTFETVSKTNVLGGAVTPISKEIGHQTIPSQISKSVLSKKIAIPSATELPTKNHLFKAMRPRTPLAPKHLYALPCAKAPIPLHRFPGPMKDQFRQALAEKAKTKPSNIQIKVVYSHIDVNLYQSMAQDNRNQLLCFPKPELLERTKVSRPQAISTFYLVFGTRLDNQESVRTLVPSLGGGAVHEP